MRGLKASKKTNAVGFDLAPFPGLTVPWIVLQGEIDQVCAPATTRAFVSTTGAARMFSLPNVGHGFAVPRNWEPQFIEAYKTITSSARSDDRPSLSVPEVEDLPLVEVPATRRPARGQMAVILTGDGGWAEIDKTIAAGLAAAGVPTIGWSSLQYFWTPRTPQGAAADLSRIITHYAAAWKTPQVLLIGYSFGADILPFLVTRLSPEAQEDVRGVTLLGPSATASFTFHISNWFGGSGEAKYETIPEIKRLVAPVTCVQGTGETDSPCGVLQGSHVSTVSVGRGHHFGGDYDRLVELILQQR